MPPRESSNEPSSADSARVPRPRLSIDGITTSPRRDFSRPVVARRPVAYAAPPAAMPQPESGADSTPTATEPEAEPPTASTTEESSPTTEPMNAAEVKSAEQPVAKTEPAETPDEAELTTPEFTETETTIPAQNTPETHVEPNEPTPIPPSTSPQFTPPPKRTSKWRRIVRFGVPVLVVLLIIAAGVGFYMWQAAKNNPDTVFKKALQASLTTSQYKTLQTGGDTLVTQEVSHNVADSKNPIISGQTTVNLNGTDFDINTYGTLKNTYVSYQELPKAIPASFAGITPNNWVQLRANSTLPAGVSASLAQAADPTYQAFGPIVFGNFPANTRQQLTDFAAKNRIYPYDVKAVERQKLNGKQVFVYPLKLNVGYLKLLNQSAASSQNVTPDALQTAARSLDTYKDAQVKLYVDKDTQRFVRVDSINDGKTQTITYSNYNQTNVPNEPQTKLQWTVFAPFQYQMQALAAVSAPAAQRDSDRRAALTALHDALAVYFAQNSSYPMPAELNSQTWVAANLSGLDPALFRDPQGTNLQLAAAPKAGTYAYQALSANGKNLCDGSAANPCAHYRLTAILSTNQPFSVQDP